MIVLCRVCNKTFNRPPNKIKSRIYCSKECYLSENNNNVLCKCKNCGKKYTVAISQEGKTFCSQKCMFHFFRKTGIWKGKTIFTCKQCNKHFTDYVRENRLFCSPECYAKSLTIPKDVLKEHQLQNLHNTRFGRNRDKALKRDKYTCQICGSIDNLVIHHIDGTGYKSVGFKNMNNKLDNLQTLCSSCHTRLHSKNRQAKT